MIRKLVAYKGMSKKIDDIVSAVSENSINHKMPFILDSLSVYVAYIHAATLRYKFVNKAFALEYALPREKIIGSRMDEILPPENYKLALPHIEKVRMGKRSNYECYFHVATGTFWVTVDYIPEFDSAGNVIAFVVLGTNITEKKRAEDKLKEREALYRFMVENASEGIVTVNRDLRITFVNDKLTTMLDYKTEELVGFSVKKILFEESLGELDMRLLKNSRQKEILFESYLREKTGAKHWVAISIKAMLDADDHYTGSFIMLTDIHARKLMEQQLEKAVKTLETLSNKDGLTNLVNRRYFDEIISAKYDELAQYSAPLSIIMIDIDYFKNFNDTYGHLAGDSCLQQVARALADSVCHPSDIVARYGGEEFICMLPEITLADVKMIAKKMRMNVEKLRIPHAASKVSDYVTVSLGVATKKCTPTNTVFEIINNADKALYQAKARGRNTINVFPCS